MTADKYLDLLIAALRKHETDGCYIDPEVGCIDGYFDLHAVATEMICYAEGSHAAAD